MVRATLDHAPQLVPDDDRVWLGKANLAIRVGADDEAARRLNACQRRRLKDIPVWARSEQLYQRNQPARGAAEMARLAEQLGRWFEARAFLTVAIAVDPARDDLRRDLARLWRPVPTTHEAAQTLADARAAEGGWVLRRCGDQVPAQWRTLRRR